MVIIKQGEQHNIPIVSPVQLTGVRLFNVSTGVFEEAVLGEETMSGSNYTYYSELSALQTLAMPLGVYDLELCSGSGASLHIEATKVRYAKIVKSSFSNS